MLNASLKNNDFICLVFIKVPILFIQKSIIKYLFDSVDFFYAL